MTPPLATPPNAVTGWQRLLLIGTGCGLIGLLVTAGCLTPNERGYGTHQGLGLPPCTFLALTKLRCPSCGMTTSWSCMVRGRVVKSLQANTGGALLALTVMAIGPWTLFSGVRGRWVLWQPNADAALVIVLAIVGVTMVDWFCRLIAG